MKNTIRFVLDGKIVEVDFTKDPLLKPSTTVLNYLRSLPGHKGVKEGCGEGDCGACTVVIAERNADGKLVYKAVDSCLLFLPMIHGKQLITVENLALEKNGEKLLHPVQKNMVETHGTQCGYCTPGIVMTLFSLFKNHRDPSREIIEDALTGNLCRCTGYQPVLVAAQRSCKDVNIDHFSETEDQVSMLLQSINDDRETILLETGRQNWYKPFSLPEALRLKQEKPDAIVVSGSTDIALRQTKKKEWLPEILDISDVRELKFFREDPDCFVFGSGISLENVKKLSEHTLPAFSKSLSVFGSLQIRNCGTLGGNIATASPVGDTLPLLFAYGALIKVCSRESERVFQVEEFIRGYRKTALENDELVTEIIVPKIPRGVIVNSFKVSRRKDLDISTVSSAFRLNIVDGVVAEIILAYGGMAEKVKRAVSTEQFLTGKTWCRENVEAAMKTISPVFTPISDTRADKEFRITAAKNLLLKFYIETCSAQIQ
jgi:xanthine dehydrogenase small subunit